MTNVPPERLLLLAEEKKPYPSDVTDDEWALVAPYRTLLPEAAGQRR